MIVNPGAVFQGTVSGGNPNAFDPVSVLELTSGASHGAISGIGSKYTGFGNVIVDAGAYWQFNGQNVMTAGQVLTVAGTIKEFQASLVVGTIQQQAGSKIIIDPSSLTVGSLLGTGVIEIGADSTLVAQGTVGAGETIGFNGAGGTLQIASLPGFSGTIAGFVLGDTLSLPGVNDLTSGTIVNGNTLELFRSGHSPVYLQLGGGTNYGGAGFTVSGSGAITTDQAPCFLRGTMIATDRGEVPVQDLAAGDRVATLSGAFRPIAWIGHGQVLVSPGRRSAATPIIVRKNALGDNIPYEDLRITKGHSLFADGVLIPAEFMVNHVSILWDDHKREVEFYHIELDTHDVLLANGALSETYRDDGNRWLFRNSNPNWNREPAAPYAPVLTGGPVVDRVWRRLLDRAGRPPAAQLTSDPDLHLLVDGIRVEASSANDGVHVFALPARPAEVRILSRAAVPAELGVARDDRALGVAVRKLVARQSARFRIMEARDPALADGFHAYEAGVAVRWTDGDALIPPALFQGFDGKMELVLHLDGVMQYPAYAEAVRRAA